MPLQTFTLANLSDLTGDTVVTIATGTSATLTSNCVALVNCTAGNYTLTLPPVAALSAGDWVGVKKTDTTANTLTVTPQAGTIDGASTYVLPGLGRSGVRLFYDGTNWWSLGVTEIAGQLPATATNDSAAAGRMGEFSSAQTLFASRASIATTNTGQNLLTLSLTAGDWNVGGSALFDLAGATITRLQGGISTTSATLPDTSLTCLSDTASTFYGATVPQRRISITTTTTVYLVVFGLYTVATPKACGFLWARRAR